MKCYKVWCEWDFGQDDCIFSNKGAAFNWMQRNIDLNELNNEFPDIQSIFDAGLAYFQELTLDP